MPHLFVKSVKPLTLPLEVEGFIFEFATTGSYRLVSVKTNNERFFLTLTEKEGKVLVKGEKKTRPWRTDTLKKGLELFSHIFCDEVVQSNVANIKEHSSFSIEVSPHFYCDKKALQRPLRVEIGFGSARHLVFQAKNNPQSDFLGIEIYKPAIKQLTRRCELDSITNIAVMDYDARAVLETLPSECVEHIYLHFPVPWPETPHRRIYSRMFVDEAFRVLVRGGTLELRTDDEGYYRLSLDVLSSLDSVSFTIHKNRDAGIVSKYEARWRRLEKNIYDVIAVKSESFESVGRTECLFQFDTKPTLDTIRSLKGRVFLEEAESIVKILEIFPHNEGFLFSVILGHRERPEFKYVYVDQKTIEYYNGVPLCVKQSVVAHNLLRELFDGK